MSSPLPPAHTPLVSSVFVRLLFDCLVANGVDASALLHCARPALDARSPARTTLPQWRDMLQRAAIRLDDPLIGLHLGQRLSMRDFGMLGYVLHACGTLGSALQRFERYERLFHDINPVTASVDGEMLVLRWGVAGGLGGPLVDDCLVSSLVQVARDISGTHLPVPFVGFVNTAPPELRPYTDFFGGKVAFNQAVTSVHVPLALMTLPLRAPDQALLHLLETQIDALLDATPGADHYELCVRRRVAHHVRDGEPDIVTVARDLNTSARTLRRRLKDRNLHFRGLVDDTRRRLAEEYLGDPRLQLAEVAALLGYAEQSTFQRAFRRWTGLTPGAWRRHQNDEAGAEQNQVASPLRLRQ